MLSDSADAPIDHVTFKMLGSTASKDVIDGGNEIVSNGGSKDIIDGGDKDDNDGNKSLEAIDIEFDVTLIQSVIEYSRNIWDMSQQRDKMLASFYFSYKSY